MRTLKHISIIKACQGLATVEFALCLPFLMSLLLGSVEMTRFELINQKLDKIAFTIADLIGQNTTVSNNELANLMIASTQVMMPYSFTSTGSYVIISSITQQGTYSASNPPKVSWQYIYKPNMPSVAVTSTVAPSGQGTAANLPTGLTLNDKDNVIVAEVYYNFAPLVNTQIITSRELYHNAIYKPRLGSLTTPPA